MDIKNSTLDNDSNFNEDLNANEFLASSKLSIKPHNFKLEGKLDELGQDLEDSKRSIQSLKNDFLRISHINNEQDNEMSRFFLDEIGRLSKELKSMNNVQTEETNFLKKQINLLNQDRIKLTQNILILENHVIENEKDVGFKNVYDL